MPAVIAKLESKQYYPSRAAQGTKFRHHPIYPNVSKPCEGGEISDTSIHRGSMKTLNYESRKVMTCNGGSDVTKKGDPFEASTSRAILTSFQMVRAVTITSKGIFCIEVCASNIGDGKVWGIGRGCPRECSISLYIFAIIELCADYNVDSNLFLNKLASFLLSVALSTRDPIIAVEMTCEDGFSTMDADSIRPS